MVITFASRVFEFTDLSNEDIEFPKTEGRRHHFGALVWEACLRRRSYDALAQAEAPAVRGNGSLRYS